MWRPARDRRGYHPLGRFIPEDLGHMRLGLEASRLQFEAHYKGLDSQGGLFPLRSPLLRES